MEAIRSEVEDISAFGLHRRVPEPSSLDEGGRLATTMNDMLGRLELSQNSQQQLVADASHELRSPLAAMPGRQGLRPGATLSISMILCWRQLRTCGHNPRFKSSPRAFRLAW